VVTLAIAGGLVTTAAGMHGHVQEQRLVTRVNALLGDLSLARSEASRRAGPVTLCKSADGATCTPASVWQDGWIVFADANDNRRVDGGETIVRVQQALDNGVTLEFRASLGRNDDVTYEPSGFTEKNGTFTFCDNRGAAKARAVILYRTGRPRASVKNSSGRSLTCPTRGSS
jgi:type IV fimbrial biogenesis protein FimT